MLIYSKTEQKDLRNKEIKALNSALGEFYKFIPSRCPFCYQNSPNDAKHFFIDKKTNKAQITKYCQKFDEVN